MFVRNATCTLLIGAITLSGAMMGCEDLPGSKGTQGAVIGGVGGAVAGAAIGGEGNRLIGALIGGALGAGGGYLIGANVDKLGGDDDDDDRRDAQAAVDKAQNDPATAAQARDARTADINDDGFVTLDEVTAMKKAGLSDDEMVRRLRATDQIFELTYEQEQQLRDAGVSAYVINEMRSINQDERQRLLRERSMQEQKKNTDQVIGGPRDNRPL